MCRVLTVILQQQLSFLTDIMKATSSSSPLLSSLVSPPFSHQTPSSNPWALHNNQQRDFYTGGRDIQSGSPSSDWPNIYMQSMNAWHMQQATMYCSSSNLCNMYTANVDIAIKSILGHRVGTVIGGPMLYFDHQPTPVNRPLTVS